MWRYLIFWGLVLTVILSWASWGIVFNQVSPVESASIAYPLFYTTLFFALASMYALFGALLRKSFSPEKSSLVCLHVAIRQGIILGIVSVIAIAFQQFSTLSWIVVLLLLIMALLIEAFFWEAKKS